MPLLVPSAALRRRLPSALEFLAALRSKNEFEQVVDLVVGGYIDNHVRISTVSARESGKPLAR